MGCNRIACRTALWSSSLNTSFLSVGRDQGSGANVRILEEIIDVVRSILHECVQCTFGQALDAPVRQMQEQTVLGVCSSGQVVPHDHFEW